MVHSCAGGFDGTVLKAVCGTGEGASSLPGLTMSSENRRSTHLDLARCPDGADIANLRGHLTCVQ